MVEVKESMDRTEFRFTLDTPMETYPFPTTSKWKVIRKPIRKIITALIWWGLLAFIIAAALPHLIGTPLGTILMLIPGTLLIIRIRNFVKTSKLVAPRKWTPETIGKISNSKAVKDLTAEIHKALEARYTVWQRDVRHSPFKFFSIQSDLKTTFILHPWEAYVAGQQAQRSIKEHQGLFFTVPFGDKLREKYVFDGAFYSPTSYQITVRRYDY